MLVVFDNSENKFCKVVTTPYPSDFEGKTLPKGKVVRSGFVSAKMTAKYVLTIAYNPYITFFSGGVNHPP